MSENNKIETRITDEDRRSGTGRGTKILAEEILESLRLARPYGTVFVRDIPLDKREAVEVELKKAFELWANSWIAPKCRQILAK